MTLHSDCRGAGPPVVLLHGWGFHSSVWDGFADDLARDRTVHLVDLPGHGHSHSEALHSLDETVDEIAPLIPAGSLVCGWSLGGLIAQRMALRHPERTRRLVLVATTPCFLRRPGWDHGVADEILEQFGQDLREHPARTLERFVRLNTFDVADARPAIRAVTERLRERPFASQQALAAGLAMLRTTDVRAEAPETRVPSLVIHGARDRITPPGAARWLAESLPDAALLELPDSAHLPFVTNRTAVLAALRDFDA